MDPLACLSDASGQSVGDSDQARIHMSHMGIAASGLQGHGPADAPGQASVTDHLDLMPDGHNTLGAGGLADLARATLPVEAQRRTLERSLRVLPWGTRKLLMQSLKRDRQALSRREDAWQEKHQSIAHAWAQGCLARGARLAVGTAIKKPRNKKGQLGNVWRHSRAWTLRGTIRLAFSCLGGSSPSQKQTRRELDAIAATSLAYTSYVEAQAACSAMHLRSGSLKPKWLLVERALDATPAKLKFGKLRPLLSPCARYWWRDLVKPATRNAGPPLMKDDPLWIPIDYNEWKRRMGSREPKSGTLEVLGQTLRVTWGFIAPNGARVTRTDSPAVAPVFLQSTSASSLLSAWEASVPYLSSARLKEIALYVKLVVLVIVCDRASSNTQMIHRIAYDVALHKAQASRDGRGCILLIENNCISHVVHGIVDSIFSLHQLAPRLHSSSVHAGHPAECCSCAAELADDSRARLGVRFPPRHCSTATMQSCHRHAPPAHLVEVQGNTSSQAWLPPGD